MDSKEKQIIYMDDKPYIKGNVVMLPTKNESSLWINCENKLKIHIKDRMCPGKQEFQHLYITLDEKLNKDEWYCSPMEIVSRYNSIEKLPSNWRKIIATTDTSWGIVSLEYSKYSKIQVINASLNLNKEHELINAGIIQPKYFSQKDWSNKLSKKIYKLNLCSNNETFYLKQLLNETD